MQVFDGIASKMTCLRLRKCAGMVIHRNPAWIKLINLIRFVSMRASGGWHALHFCQPKGIKVEQTNFEFYRNATHVSECYLVFNNSTGNEPKATNKPHGYITLEHVLPIICAYHICSTSFMLY